ncbi:DUF6282 family protein [Anaerobacillus sp. MEB173]|uniref:DUF6282 family protein n=1 Tax=Anaerobacillus sp. MEB173 TaxID=3383345 RepID=UPI003F8DA6A6
MISTFHPLLEGAFELHVHNAPSLAPQKQTDLELIEDVKRASLAGVILKGDEFESVQRAQMIRSKEPELHVYGEFVCNHFAGGLSPAAVEKAIQAGAKIISMPTLSALNHQRYFGTTLKHFNKRRNGSSQNNGLVIWDENQKVLPQVHAILELIANNDVVLATGHISSDEINVLVEAALKHRVEKILVQQTDLGISRLPYEAELEFARKGCFIEKSYLACSEDYQALTLRQMAKSIKLLGADSCVMVTNYGQLHNISPIDAMNLFVEDMLHVGISGNDIRKMIVDNPRKLLGLDATIEAGNRYHQHSLKRVS